MRYLVMISKAIAAPCWNIFVGSFRSDVLFPRRSGSSHTMSRSPPVGHGMIEVKATQLLHELEFIVAIYTQPWPL